MGTTFVPAAGADGIDRSVGDGSASALGPAQDDQLALLSVQAQLGVVQQAGATAGAASGVSGAGDVPAPTPDLLPGTVSPVGTLGSTATADGVQTTNVPLANVGAPTSSGGAGYVPPTIPELAAMTDEQAMAAIAELEVQHRATWNGDDEGLRDYANNAHGPTTTPGIKALYQNPWFIAHLGQALGPLAAAGEIPPDVVELLRQSGKLIYESTFYTDLYLQDPDAYPDGMKDLAASYGGAGPWVVGGVTYTNKADAIAAVQAIVNKQGSTAAAPGAAPVAASPSTSGVMPAAALPTVDRAPNVGAPLQFSPGPTPSAGAAGAPKDLTVSASLSSGPTIVLVIAVLLLVATVVGVIKLPKSVAGPAAGGAP